MNWKKVFLFILFLIVGIFLFGLITLFSGFRPSWFLPLFFIAFIVFLVLILKEYSTKKLLTIFLLVAIYWLIMAIPFPECESGDLKCTCIGLKKVANVFDSSSSQCVGIPINYHYVYSQKLQRDNNSLIEEIELIS